jgi:hypothetical protein
VLVVACAHGNAVSTRILRLQIGAFVAAFLAGTGVYLDVWFRPMYHVFVWGTSQLAFSVLASLLLVAFFAVERDYVLAVTVIATMSFLGVALVDFITGSDNVGLVAVVVSFAVVLVGLLYHREVEGHIGRNRSWRFFNVLPAIADPGAEQFARQVLEDAVRRGSHLRAGIAKILLGRCRYRKGDIAGGIEQVTEAVTLFQASARGQPWRCVALTQLAEWALRAGPDHADEALDAADAAVAAGAHLSRAGLLRARGLIDRAVAQYQRQATEAAAHDAEEAMILLVAMRQKKNHDRNQLLAAAEDLLAELSHTRVTARQLRRRVGLPWMK